MESIDVPKNYVKLIVGKGRSTIDWLSREFGEAYIKTPDSDENGTDGMVSVTITSRRKSFVQVLEAIFNIFKDTGKDASFLWDTMDKYGVRHENSADIPRRRSLLSTPSDSSNNPSMLEALPKPVQGFPPKPLMEVQILDASFANLEQECDVFAGSSGWGPLVDRHFMEEDPQVENNIREDYFIPQQGSTGDQHSDFPIVLPHIPHTDSSIEDKSGFISLSQHVVIKDFYPLENEHKATLCAKAAEIVTFTKPCDCSNSCSYGYFRNAVGMLGCIPMSLISEKILKFECPYCDDVHEFYQERDYLKHICAVHFWRRLCGFLNQTAPFKCTLRDCKYQGRTFEELVFHYGAVPHRKVGALILDSVGERVRHLKNSSTTMSSKLTKEQNYLREELDKSDSVIRDLQKTLQDKATIQSRSDPDIQYFQDKVKTQSSEMQLLQEKCGVLEERLMMSRDQDKGNEQLNRRIRKCEGEMNEKETAIKQLQEAIKLKREKIVTHENTIRHHEKYIRELETQLKDLRIKQKEMVENPIITLDEDQEKVAELSRQLEKLKKESNDKDSALNQMSADVEILNSKLAEAQKVSGGDVQVVLPVSDDSKDAMIEKLKKLIKSQKAMLALKQQEIDLYKDQVNEDL